jgi:hypothetical protein
MAPTPTAVADAMEVIELGGDPHRLAAACRIRAADFDAAGRQRLLDAADAMDWAARLLSILDGDQGVEDAHAEC